MNEPRSSEQNQTYDLMNPFKIGVWLIFLSLSGFYLYPLIRESRHIYICSLFLTDRNQITLDDAGKQLGLKKYSYLQYPSREETLQYPVHSYCKIVTRLID